LGIYVSDEVEAFVRAVTVSVS